MMEWVHRIGLAIGTLLVYGVLAGCATGPSSDDAFLSRIHDDYPELDGKPVEVALVRRVVDGDTFETDSGRKVRLIGANTPEVTGKAEHYGHEASDFARRRLEGRTVYLFRDVSETDRYGRLLRYVFVQDDPAMWNETLLAKGYANVMTVPPDVLFAEKYVRLERRARTRGAGLWGKGDNASSVRPSCPDPQIKGNLNSRNEKIYHLPGGSYYDQTIAEEMFCTEEEAISAGFRKSSR